MMIPPMLPLKEWYATLVWAEQSGIVLTEANVNDNLPELMIEVGARVINMAVRGIDAFNITVEKRDKK